MSLACLLIRKFSREKDVEPAHEDDYYYYEDYYTGPIKHLSAAQDAYIEAGVHYMPMHLMRCHCLLHVIAGNICQTTAIWSGKQQVTLLA